MPYIQSAYRQNVAFHDKVCVFSQNRLSPAANVRPECWIDLALSHIEKKKDSGDSFVFIVYSLVYFARDCITIYSSADSKNES